jgi:hypothetical protein
LSANPTRQRLTAPRFAQSSTAQDWDAFLLAMISRALDPMQRATDL